MWTGRSRLALCYQKLLEHEKFSDMCTLSVWRVLKWGGGGHKHLRTEEATASVGKFILMRRWTPSTCSQRRPALALIGTPRNGRPHCRFMPDGEFPESLNLDDSKFESSRVGVGVVSLVPNELVSLFTLGQLLCFVVYSRPEGPNLCLAFIP